MDTCAICSGTGEVEDMEGFWTACPCVGDIVTCDRCGHDAPEHETGEDEATGETVCLACHLAAEAAYHRTTWDPQLIAWHEQREREREARPVPAGLDGTPF